MIAGRVINRRRRAPPFSWGGFLGGALRRLLITRGRLFHRPASERPSWLRRVRPACGKVGAMSLLSDIIFTRARGAAMR
jgi:hypothetical protein